MSDREQDLAGRVAIVTGGCGAIGGAISRELLVRGAKVALLDVDQEQLSRDVDDLRARFDDSVLGLQTDMTVPEQIERSVADVAARFSTVDILVNNLGLVRPSAFMDMSLDLWESVMSTNVTAAMLCSQSAARHMARQGYGSIVNISSQAAEMSAPGASAYAVSKAAINGLTRAMAVELVADNIRVNAVAPHHIMTPATNPQFLNEQRIPMNRTGTPGEVADAVAFFASERASFVTGQCLNVNGGFNVNMFNSVMYSGDRR